MGRDRLVRIETELVLTRLAVEAWTVETRRLREALMSDQPTAPADDPMNPGGVSTPGEAIGAERPDDGGEGRPFETPPVDPGAESPDDEGDDESTSAP